MKTLVIGGMHGNEPLGLEIVQKIKDQPIANVDSIIGSRYAAKVGLRYGVQDLNRSFPGNSQNAVYEIRRAAQLLKLTTDYDVVLDFHNTQCPDNDCSFLGEDAQSKLYDLSSWLGLQRIVVVDYDCINKYASNCISVEISNNSDLMNADLWYQRIGELAVLEALPKADGVEKYKFLSRITNQDKEKLNLPNENLVAFKELRPGLAEQLGQTGSVYPIFINDAYTPYNYGALVARTDV